MTIIQSDKAVALLSELALSSYTFTNPDDGFACIRISQELLKTVLEFLAEVDE